ncbi:MULTISPECIES: 50S ribosomal protein L11 methyltransferase [unclassified Streptomyces]|uniref:50S ribosomal protein L11 methyltransferase n=1 Tax=Streptomyces sp. NBC_00060 TaxID=2975636 RepID=A0AAU2H3W3_9ACTN
MTEIKNYLRSLERSRAALLREDRPRTFALAGREWDLLDGVFAPPFSASTGAAMELLGLTGPERAPWHGSLLEVGSGTGVIAVCAALAGGDRVTALDINEQAVRNTEMNAHRHGVADRLTAVHSDLFDALGADERYDTVYWHSNFVLAPPTYRHETVHEQAYVDPGYRAHRRYLAEAPAFAADGGRVLLHFSDRGDIDALHEIAAECDRSLRVLGSRRIGEGEETVEHILYEITVP